MKLIALFAALASAQVLAADPINVTLHVAKNQQGQPLYSSRYFSSAKLGILQGALSWTNYGEPCENGFKLSLEELVSFKTPVLPADCTVKGLKGTLNADPNGDSPFSITVSGVSCEAFIADASKLPLVLEFKNVAHQNGTGVTDRLVLTVTE